MVGRMLGETWLNGSDCDAERDIIGTLGAETHNRFSAD